MRVFTAKKTIFILVSTILCCVVAGFKLTSLQTPREAPRVLASRTEPVSSSVISSSVSQEIVSSSESSAEVLALEEKLTFEEFVEAARPIIIESKPQDPFVLLPEEPPAPTQQPTEATSSSSLSISSSEPASSSSSSLSSTSSSESSSAQESENSSTSSSAISSSASTSTTSSVSSISSQSSSLSSSSSVSLAPTNVVLISECLTPLAVSSANAALAKGILLEKAQSISCNNPNLAIWLNAIQVAMPHYTNNFFLPGSDYLANGGYLQMKIQTRLIHPTIGEIIGVADHDQVWLSLAQPDPETVEHELFHVTDFKIYGNYSSLNPDPLWAQLNVEGFSYTNYDLNFTKRWAGFARSYGMASWSEDRATIYEAYREGVLDNLIANDQVLKNKWDFLKAQLISVGVVL